MDAPDDTITDQKLNGVDASHPIAAHLTDGYEVLFRIEASADGALWETLIPPFPITGEDVTLKIRGANMLMIRNGYRHMRVVEV
jgi:hypothetical protein